MQNRLRFHCLFAHFDSVIVARISTATAHLTDEAGQFIHALIVYA